MRELIVRVSCFVANLILGEPRLVVTEAQEKELALVWRLRRVLTALDPAAALELLIDKIRVTKSNEQFLREISKAPVTD